MDVVVSKFYSHFSVLYLFLLLLRISSNVLRLFPFKRKAAGWSRLETGAAALCELPYSPM